MFRFFAAGLVVSLLFLSSCAALFGEAGYTDERGVKHPPKEGLVGQGASVLKTLYPPAGWILSAINGAGMFLTHNRGKKKHAKDYIRALGGIKKDLSTAFGLMSEEDFNALILKYLPPDKSEVGALLRKVHTSMREKGESTAAIAPAA